MSRARTLWLIVAITSAMLFGSPTLALPDLGSSFELADVLVFSDHELEHRFYYAPGALEIARDPGGRPQFRFLQLRYIGSKQYGTAGQHGSLSTLTFRIRMAGPRPEHLAALLRLLRTRAGRVGIDLRPLPVSDFEATVVFAPISPGADAPSEVVAGGHFDADDRRDSLSGRDGFWRERGYSIAMDEDTSQLLWGLLQGGEVAMSVNYAFLALGVTTDERTDLRVEGDADAVEAMTDALEGQGLHVDQDDPKGATAILLERVRRVIAATESRLGGSESGDGEPDAEEGRPEPEVRKRVVRAGVVELAVDADRWPDLFHRVDFNAELPPGYATLKVYCYDFKNALRPDLVYKKVEVEAETAAGTRTAQTTKFLFSQPDLYAATIRFPVAVRLDRPYRYRVITAALDGSQAGGSWNERDNWAPILDVTSRPATTVGRSQEVE